MITQGFDSSGRLRFTTNGPLTPVSLAEVQHARALLFRWSGDTVTLAGNTVTEDDLSDLLSQLRKAAQA